MRFTTLLLILSIAIGAYAEKIWVSPWGLPETAPTIELIQSDNGGVTIGIEISGFFAEEIRTDAGIFYRLRLKEDFTPTTMEIGSPELPQLAELLQIPRGCAVKVAEIKGDFIRLQGYTPYPFQKPLKDGETSAAFEYNRSKYQAGKIFPAEPAQIGETGIWRHLQVAGIRISPIHYDSKDNSLLVYRNLTVRINFVPGQTEDYPLPETGISPTFDKIYRNTILNYDPSEYALDDTDDEVGVKYLVICPEEALSYIEPLVELRHSQGYKVEIMTLSPTFRTPEEFKLAITMKYLSDGLEYVLLVGDANLSNPVAPMYYWDYDPSNISYSDSWYTCVVPGGDGDHFPELAIGRYVYNNLNELQHQIDKTMDYLLTYDVSRDWFEKSLLVAHDEEYPLKYTQCKEEIRTYNYDIQTPVFSTIYGGAGGGNLDIVNYINGGSCGLFNYRGHGSETNWPQWSGWSSFTSSQVNAMTNQHQLFVIFDICCSNGDIVSYSGECLSETFMKANYAAAAILSAINPSYTDPNHIFDKELYKSVFDYGVSNIGYASNDASVIVNNQFGIYGQANFRMYYWQGDPAIDLWTHIPATAEVTAPDNILPGQSSAEITVEADGSPFPDAMVCIQNEEIYTVGYTDANGEALLEFDPLPLTLGEACLTVSGHNLAFYQDTLTINGGFGAIEGYVRSNQTSEPLNEARVSLPYLEMETCTDTAGYYIFDDIPALEYELTAEFEGYVDSTRMVEVDSGGVVQLDFYLLHPECIPGVDEISVAVNQGEPAEYDFEISNEGDYPLEYTMEITADDAGPTLEERMNLDASVSSGDEELQGLAFDGEIIWVAGSGEDNLLHKFDAEGNFLESIPQPETSTNHGFYDICWDGAYFYGAESSDIVKFDTNGVYLETIPTNMNPVQALTSDFSGQYFYIGNGTSNIWKVDTTGAVVRFYGNNLNVRGFAWREDDPDSYKLYILSNEPEVTVSKMNVSNGNKITLGEVPGVSPNSAGGCWLTSDLDPQYIMLMGVVQNEGDDEIQGWQVDKLFDWLAISPDSGSISGGEAQSFTVHFDPLIFAEGVFEAELKVLHNALGGETAIPVQMTVNPSGSQPEDDLAGMPSEFRLYQNRPNPFNQETMFHFDLPSAHPVKFTIYDILGRVVARQDLGLVTAGNHSFKFDAAKLSSGIYFCRMEAGEFKTAVKLMLLK